MNEPYVSVPVLFFACVVVSIVSHVISKDYPRASRNAGVAFTLLMFVSSLVFEPADEWFSPWFLAGCVVIFLCACVVSLLVGLPFDIYRARLRKKSDR